jgi:hypothetical protein
VFQLVALFDRAPHFRSDLAAIPSGCGYALITAGTDSTATRIPDPAITTHL